LIAFVRVFFFDIVVLVHKEGDALSPLLFNCALEYAFRRV